jgi:hypothetical protein
MDLRHSQRLHWDSSSFGQSAECRANTDIVVEVMGSAIAMGVCIPSANLQQNGFQENRNADNTEDSAYLCKSD